VSVRFIVFGFYPKWEHAKTVKKQEEKEDKEE
jgi:hypothetical protein